MGAGSKLSECCWWKLRNCWEVGLLDTPLHFLSWVGCWTSHRSVCAERDVRLLVDYSWKLHSFLGGQQAHWLGDWLEKLHNFLGTQGRTQGVCLACQRNFFNQKSEQGLQFLRNFLGEWVSGSLSGQTLWLTSLRVGWFACGQCRLRWLAEELLHCFGW